MNLGPTQRLYLDDARALHARACVLAVEGNRVAFDRSPFYPGGGGQPPDRGRLALDDGRAIDVLEVAADDAGVVWHQCADATALRVGQRVTLIVEGARRAALSRFHTVLHVLNTVAMRDFNAWITGCQIGADYSRIDFKLDRLSPELVQSLTAAVNEVLVGDHPVRSLSLPEDEFRRRPELLRTLDVRPPVVDGRVRVIEIEGFDAQACGGTHVAHTREIGRLRIVRTENKGRSNKRLYVEIDALAPATLPA
jgi:misacylated tRNA(Ala) deacylase